MPVRVCRIIKDPFHYDIPVKMVTQSLDLTDIPYFQKELTVDNYHLPNMGGVLTLTSHLTLFHMNFLMYV